MKEAVLRLGTLHNRDTTPNKPSFLTEAVPNGPKAHATEFEIAS